MSYYLSNPLTTTINATERSENNFKCSQHELLPISIFHCYIVCFSMKNNHCFSVVKLHISYS